MGFLDGLFKGFVRSAVNQVGRDGGKIISNKIYRGQHSTPVSTDDYLVVRERYAGNPSMPTIGNLLTNVILFAILVVAIPLVLLNLSPVLAFPFPVFFMGRVYRPLFRSYVNPRVVQGVYKADRRFKTGARRIGSQMATDKTVRVPLSEEEVRIYRIEGVIKLILFIVVYVAMVGIVRTPKFQADNMTEISKTRILHAGDSLMKEKKFIYYYGKVKGRHGVSYEQMAYDTTATFVTFAGVDSIQSNTDYRTEMQRIKNSPEYKEFKPEFQIMFKVKPAVKPILHEDGKRYRKTRVGKEWFIDPDDVKVSAWRVEH